MGLPSWSRRVLDCAACLWPAGKPSLDSRRLSVFGASTDRRGQTHFAILVLNRDDLRKKARKLSVAVKDADKNWRSRSEIEEDYWRAINRSLVEETVGAAPGHASASMDSSPSMVAI